VLITPVKPFSCRKPHTLLSPALAEYNLLYSTLLFSPAFFRHSEAVFEAGTFDLDDFDPELLF
jgi:hypothetical protein